MFTEKEREKVNRYLSDQTFECSVPLLHSDTKYMFEYRFKIVGERRMMSVGEYYMYSMIDVELLEIEEKYRPFFKIIGKDFDKSKLENVFFKKDYLFLHHLGECVREQLTYLTTGGYPRVDIGNITMSDELYNNIMNKEI